jgi:redox-sensitive bicupin YhaK (pirin superfamily)
MAPMTRLTLTIAALAATCIAAQAQNAKPPLTNTKPLIDNAQVRVTEMSFQPGAKTGIVNQPNRFVYALTDGALVFSPPGKHPYELSFKAGEALWLTGEAMATENDTDKEVRALVVELKAPVRPAAPAGKGKRKSGSKAKTGKAPAKSRPGG